MVLESEREDLATFREWRFGYFYEGKREDTGLGTAVHGLLAFATCVCVCAFMPLTLLLVFATTSFYD